MMESMPFLISGILFGLVAGISPGPLLTLVISETLKHNKREGIIVASAPILTDVPIVLLSVFILAKLSNFNFVLGIISILGALFIGYLAWESLSTYLSHYLKGKKPIIGSCYLGIGVLG